MFGHLPGPGPSRRKLCELFLLEIRNTGSPPKQEFLIFTGVGYEVHLGFFPPTKGLFLYVISATPFRIANYVVAFKDELKCSFSLSSIHASINPVATKDIAREKNPKIY